MRHQRDQIPNIIDRKKGGDHAFMRFLFHFERFAQFDGPLSSFKTNKNQEHLRTLILAINLLT